MVGLVKCALVLCAAVAASGFGLQQSQMVFHLYTRNNPTLSEPLLANLNSISSATHLSLARFTVFTIHDHGEGVGGNFNAFLIPAHLSASDVNVISVDWSAGASMYTEGLANAPQVGQEIANFINILISPFGYNPNLIRIVGHGLGGHIAGIAASRASREIPHIVALDPSLHGWTHNSNILKPEDAGVVEVLHTTAGVQGYDYPLGDLDFYPNGGSAQTGCGSDADCSHIFAYAFYAESLTVEVNGGNEFIGTQCESYDEARAQACAGERDVYFGGTGTKILESGIYHFQTNALPPFARG